MRTTGVFDGKKTEPYTEFAEPSPVNICGKSIRQLLLQAAKAASERLRNYALELGEMNSVRDWREALDDYLDRHFSCAKASL
jgi:hypothetical protein